MKVLEKGEIWSIEEYCTGKGNGKGGCNSKLLIDAEDVYETRVYDWEGKYDMYFTFTCPVCGAETDIDQSKLSGNVLGLARNHPITLERYKR